QNGVKVPMILPNEPLKIEFGRDGIGYSYIEYINITDIDGTKYRYGKIDGSTGNAVEKTNEPDIWNGQLGYLPTAWYLVKIISVDGSDEISLSYTTQGRSYYNARQSASLGDRIRSANTIFEGGDGDDYEDNLIEEMVMWYFQQTDVVVDDISKPSVPTVTGIQFNGGSVAFTYNSPGQFLTQMVVNKGSTPYKKITFNSSKPAQETDIYYLNDITFYGEDQVTAGEKYLFTYYDSPGGGTIPANYEACQWKDWWGYYGGSPWLLRYQSVPVSKIAPFADPTYQDIGSTNMTREPHEYMVRMGMLKTITYPTGGNTEFIYEQNQYNGPGYIGGENTYLGYGPGIRIKEVISTPVAGKPIHKVYKYGFYEDGRGHLNSYFHPGSSEHNSILVMQSIRMHYWTYNINSVEYQAGFRFRDYYADPYLSFDFGGNTVKYDAVTEYYDSAYNYRHKTQTRYSLSPQGTVQDFIVNDYEDPIWHPRKYVDPGESWQPTVMTEKNIYRYNYANSQFDLQRKENYYYTFFSHPGDTAWDMPTYLHTQIAWARGGSTIGADHYNAANYYHSSNASVYGYGFRMYTTGTQVLHRSTVEEFTPTGSIVTQKDMDVEDTYHFVRSEQLTNSDGKVNKTLYKYPHDFPGITVYQQMVQKNVLAPIVEKIDSVGASQVKKMVTNYYAPYTNVFVPQTIEIKNGNSSQYTAATFNQYDASGNIVQMQKQDDVYKSYIWDHDNSLPVAEVTNASSSSIGFTSFEADGKGGWVYSGATSADNTSPTGSRCYLLSGGNITRSGLVSTNYIISYWGKSGSVTVNGSGPSKTGKTIGNWTYYEHHLTGTSITVSGSNYIDELRLYPAGAQMTTYTFNRFIGMTTQCDLNGRITYYEYDLFGRLKLIRDQDKNVIKVMDYQYKVAP
ncbi:MAG TPA: hypothetical protein VHM26_02960, partial [Chitinophagaceae bacterium]|nr:hypothetical protein [Chitinophagaceae bacterium]